MYTIPEEILNIYGICHKDYMRAENEDLRKRFSIDVERKEKELLGSDPRFFSEKYGKHEKELSEHTDKCIATLVAAIKARKNAVMVA